MLDNTSTITIRLQFQQSDFSREGEPKSLNFMNKILYCPKTSNPTSNFQRSIVINFVSFMIFDNKIIFDREILILLYYYLSIISNNQSNNQSINQSE